MQVLLGQQEVPDGLRLGLGEGLWAVVGVVTLVVGRTTLCVSGMGDDANECRLLTVPVVAEVPVGIDAAAAEDGGVVRAGLPPQPGLGGGGGLGCGDGHCGGWW